jgi:hypothetical protein
MAGTTGLEPATSAVTVLKLGAADGFFQRPETPMVTAIGPLMDLRPLPF